jgi:hypothetical protein
VLQRQGRWSDAQFRAPSLAGAQGGLGPVGNQPPLLLGEGGVEVQHERIGVCAQLSDEEWYALRHETGDEGDVARERERRSSLATMTGHRAWRAASFAAEVWFVRQRLGFVVGLSGAPVLDHPFSFFVIGPRMTTAPGAMRSLCRRDAVSGWHSDAERAAPLELALHLLLAVSAGPSSREISCRVRCWPLPALTASERTTAWKGV